jgi:hypothetical protein
MEPRIQSSFPKLYLILETPQYNRRIKNEPRMHNSEAVSTERGLTNRTGTDQQDGDESYDNRHI